MVMEAARDSMGETGADHRALGLELSTCHLTVMFCEKLPSTYIRHGGDNDRTGDASLLSARVLPPIRESTTEYFTEDEAASDTLSGDVLDSRASLDSNDHNLDDTATSAATSSR